MKNLTLFFMVLSFLSNAQVGVGTETPANSSILDVYSTEKGVLFPRIALTDLTSFAPITGTQIVGLMVFNTDSVTGIGLHFWDGTQWKAVNGVKENWLTSGSIGTDYTVDFIGNIDNEPLVFRTNNEPKMTLGIDNGTSYLNFISSPDLDGRTFSGSITGFSYGVDLGTDGNAGDAVTASNAFGIDNQVYLRSGTTINNQVRGIRNRIWAINNTAVPNIVGVQNDLKFEGSGTSRSTTNMKLYDANLRMTAGAGINEYKAFNHTFQSNIKLNDFYGLWFERADNINSNDLSRYYSFYQGFLGNQPNRFFLYYNGDGDDSDPRSSDDNDVVVTGSGNLGLGTSTPNSTVQINGSFSASFAETSSSGPTFSLDERHYTLRVLDNITTVAIPDAANLTGRIYILIGTNGISPKNLSVGGASVIIDDVTNTNITQLNANQRLSIQSDGTNWIVIGN